MTDETSPHREVEYHRPTVEVDGLPLSEGFPVRKLTLTVLTGQDTGRSVTLDKPNIRLGADALCDFVLTEPTVSRNHAEIRQRGQAFVLVDLNSTNGTFLHDERVDTIELTDGATFRLGRTELRFDMRMEKVAIRTTQRTQYDNIIGQSQALREIFSILDRVAPSELSVVIEGETGSGKELIARALHDHSTRKDGPFVVFDCSAFPPSLLESELFGHEKGAFTGAHRTRLGRFELADGGTLFLDEIGDISPMIQLKLLRVLQERQLERVGGEDTIEVDVRVVTATNKDLKKEVEAGRFREDLFYRLHIIPIELPPLRERKEDIPALVEHFVSKLAQRTRSSVEGIAAEAMNALQVYNWPGNVRELENVIEHSMVFAEGSLIRLDDLPPVVSGVKQGDVLDIPEGDRSLPEILEELEHQLILRAFKKAKGVKTETARLLGIKPSALYYKLDKYSVDESCLG